LSVSKFFTAIKDGTWHNINVLSQQLQLQTDKLTELSKFLHEQGVIKYEEKNNRIKIEPAWQAILPEEEEKLNQKFAAARQRSPIPIKPA